MHNIIPRHVVELLKNTSRYSENHREAGILFASIVNFHELYDESYEGGKECLRVLNELVGDFDELLSKPQVRMRDNDDVVNEICGRQLDKANILSSTSLPSLVSADRLPGKRAQLSAKRAAKLGITFRSHTLAESLSFSFSPNFILLPESR